MNKKEIIKAISAKTGYAQRDVTEVIDVMIDTITETLEKGESVNFAGFGRFEVVSRAGRNGVNPKTGAKITIAPKRVPKFRPGKNFKEAVA